MRHFIFIFLILALNNFGMAQIKISKEKNIDLSAYKTFAIEKGQVVSFIKDKKLNENKIFQIFKDAVTQELTLRGYQLVSDSMAQLTVSYVYEEKNGQESQKPGPLGQTPINDPANMDGEYSRSRAGDVRTLIIDIEKNNDSVWTANCSLNGDQKDLNKAFSFTIEAALKKFPMQGKKKR